MKTGKFPIEIVLNYNDDDLTASLVVEAPEPPNDASAALMMVIDKVSTIFPLIMSRADELFPIRLGTVFGEILAAYIEAQENSVNSPDDLASVVTKVQLAMTASTVVQLISDYKNLAEMQSVVSMDDYPEKKIRINGTMKRLESIIGDKLGGGNE